MIAILEAARAGLLRREFWGGKRPCRRDRGRRGL